MTLLFCSECNNLLFPREEKEEKKLIFFCKQCDYEEEATHNCVYRNILRADLRAEQDQDMNANLKQWRDYLDDPTLPRTEKECPRCHFRQAVVYSEFSHGKWANLNICLKCAKPYQDDDE